jgi:hypothetical protein
MISKVDIDIRHDELVVFLALLADRRLMIRHRLPVKSLFSYSYSALAVLVLVLEIFATSEYDYHFSWRYLPTKPKTDRAKDNNISHSNGSQMTGRC